MNPNVSKAVAAHGAWKNKFRDFMDDKIDLDAHTVQRTNACEFGQWLEGEGKQVLGEHFQEVNQLHAQFHATAADVVRKKQSGAVNEASDALGISGSFTKASAGLVQKLMKL